MNNKERRTSIQGTEGEYDLMAAAGFALCAVVGSYMTGHDVKYEPLWAIPMAAATIVSVIYFRIALNRLMRR